MRLEDNLLNHPPSSSLKLRDVVEMGLTFSSGSCFVGKEGKKEGSKGGCVVKAADGIQSHKRGEM